MRQIKYRDSMNIQEIQQTYTQRTKTENLVYSQFYNQSFINYPYFFENQARINFILTQQKQLYEEKKQNLEAANNKLIVIRKVKDFSMIHEEDVQKIWLIDNNSLRVVKQFNGDMDNVEISEFQRKYISIEKVKQTTKFGNILFIGRTQIEGRSICIEDNRCVSAKHAILSKQLNTTKCTETFLMCYKKMKINQHLNKFSQLFLLLDSQIVRNIVFYLGRIQKDRYILIDNSSSNGTFYYPYGELSLNSKLKQQLIISKQEGFALKVNNVLRKTKLSSVNVNIDHAMAQAIKQGNVQVMNRNRQIENAQRKEEDSFYALLITVKTPRKNKLFVLYNEEAPYHIVKYQQDITIIGNSQLTNGFPSGVNYGEIRCLEENWTLFSHQIHFLLKPNTNYRLKNDAHIQIGKNTKLIITVDSEFHRKKI